MICLIYRFIPVRQFIPARQNGENIIPIPGTKRRKYLVENAGAVDLALDAADMAEIETLLHKYPDTGARYSEENNKLVDKS